MRASSVSQGSTRTLAGGVAPTGLHRWVPLPYSNTAQWVMDPVQEDQLRQLSIPWMRFYGLNVDEPPVKSHEQALDLIVDWHRRMGIVFMTVR